MDDLKILSNLLDELEDINHLIEQITHDCQKKKKKSKSELTYVDEYDFFSPNR